MGSAGDTKPLLEREGAWWATDWSPDGRNVLAVFYEKDQTYQIVLIALRDGSTRVLKTFERRLPQRPRFSPDGNKVITSMARDGNTEIYTMDLRTRAVTRLTNHPAIDTGPYYSPDGSKIVFESDRSGTQQLYIMDASGEINGAPAKRISFGTGRYATPVWSPRGDLIAFTRINSGTFSIGVMRPDGSGERILTESFLVEGPTWAPNGRVLMYYRQGRMNADGTGGEPQLWSIDLTGRNERAVVTPALGSDPAWSPLLS